MTLVEDCKERLKAPLKDFLVENPGFSGKKVQVYLKGVEVRAELSFEEEDVRVDINPEDLKNADLCISGYPIDLLHWLIARSRGQIPKTGNRVSIRGNGEMLDLVAKAMRGEKSWPEEVLSALFGKDKTSALMRRLKQVPQQFETLADYLKDEASLLVDSSELDTLAQAVDDARSEIARLRDFLKKS